MSINRFYTDDFFQEIMAGSLRSAREIVPLILELVQPKSVVDVGCGLGIWLSVFKEFGIKECLGIDGNYIDKNMLRIPQEEFLSLDLKKPLQIDKKFELVVSLEVAEHIPAECAEIFIDSLTSLGSVVLFSAAIPFQGGTGHLNEQWPHYWAKYFWKNKYSAIDCLRKVIWNNEKVEPWYAQNMLFFVRDDSIKKYPLLERELGNTIMSQLAIVHPKIYRENVMEIPAESLPRTAEDNYVIRVEITEPIGDIFSPAIARRLVCIVELEGFRIGKLELPICDGIVSSYVLADAIAAEFAWPIIGKFFERTIYPTLSIKREPAGFSIWRGKLRLTEVLARDEQIVREQMHEQIGWTIFLQEIWGCKDLPQDSFYTTYRKLSLTKVSWKTLLRELGERCIQSYLHFFKVTKARQQTINSGWITIEISDKLSDMKVSRGKLDIILTACGTAIGSVTVHVKRNIVCVKELRVVLTKASGFELCRVAVREGVLGRPLIDMPSSLRARLIAKKDSVTQRCSDNTLLESCNGFIFAPGLRNAFDLVLPRGKHGTILGRHVYEKIATSVSRRATLPASTVSDLINASRFANEPVIQIPGEGNLPICVIYAPELIWRPLQDMQASSAEVNETVTTQVKNSESGNKSYFDTLFANKIHPRNYASPYELTKYEQTLALLPSTGIERALELACAEGHFTARIAPRVGSLVATDISKIALDQAAKRCAGIENIVFKCLDLTEDPLPGRFELIVCSEALYYVGNRTNLEFVARKLTDALEPRGYLLMAHAHVVVDDPDNTGFNWNLQFGAKVISETFTSIHKLQLIKELRTPLYRIQLFQRHAQIHIPFYHTTPEIVNLKYQPTPLQPEVAAWVSWRSGGHPRTSTYQGVFTDQLPILMYHHVSPTGSNATECYRVTSETFEAQLHYLRDTGYYSISLEDWYTAMEKKKPFPGKAIILTFDDGYLDFKTYAWPLLKRYGFLAIVFLVTDNIGRSNSWDSVYGEEIPLLDWEDIRQLHDEGVEFGSHSASHPFLTALSPEKIVLEGVCSRAILGRELGLTVKAFAYPYGDVDQVVQHLIGACGYIFGLSTRRDLCRFHDPLLALPRIEVMGSDNLQNFIAKLGVHQTQDTAK